MTAHGGHTCSSPGSLLQHVLSVSGRPQRILGESGAMATAVNIFRPLLVARALFLPSACSAAGLSVLKQPTCLATAKLTIRGWRRFNRACTKGRSFSALSQRRTRKALAEPRERVPGSPADPRLLRFGSVSWPASRLAHH